MGGVGALFSMTVGRGRVFLTGEGWGDKTAIFGVMMEAMLGERVVVERGLRVMTSGRVMISFIIFCTLSSGNVFLGEGKNGME
jgi:hypothetical protein